MDIRPIRLVVCTQSSRMTLGNCMTMHALVGLDLAVPVRPKNRFSVSVVRRLLPAVKILGICPKI